MKIEIKDIPAGDLRLKLLLTNSINTREQVFLKCKASIAVLVLDPRFCFTLGHQLFNTEMLNRGITQLTKPTNLLNYLDFSLQINLKCAINLQDKFFLQEYETANVRHKIMSKYVDRKYVGHILYWHILLAYFIDTLNRQKIIWT